MSQPPTPYDELRSPGGSATGNQSAFIYPIRSAVSVKPSKPELSSDSDSISASSQKSSQKGGKSLHSSTSAKTAREFSKKPSLTSFNLNLPSKEQGRQPTTLGTDDNEASGSVTPLNDDDIEARSSSQDSWPAEDEEDYEDDEAADESRTKGSHPSVEDSRMMKEGGLEAKKPGNSQEQSHKRKDSTTTETPSRAAVAQKDMMETMTQPRFRHVETEHGHMVLTGRDGEIARCEDEPIHIPGAVQSFGCMIVLREDVEGMLVVRQVSENTGDILGLSPSYLFAQESFLDCLDEDQADILWDNVESLDDNNHDLSESGPHVFRLAGWGQPGPGKGKARARRHWDCWCAIHHVQSIPTDVKVEDDPKWKKPLVVLEFELINDVNNPLEERTPPPTPEDTSGGGHSAGLGSSTVGSSPPPSVTTIDSDGTTKVTSAVTISSKARGGLEGMPYIPTPEQFVESTQSASKPIKALQRLRRQDADEKPRRRRVKRDQNAPGFGAAQDPTGGADTLDMFGILSQVNEQLTAESDLQGFLKVAVSVIREITGFSRVMIYQFDERWNGQVVCELVDWNDTHDLYRGLHFPASDIPKQARDLYMINKIRLLYDRDQPSARMVCREMEDLKTPVDMSHSFLRAMSPIHVKYLANMGVRASMSISIIAFDQLWGLIALHTYGSKGKRISFPMRQLCRLIGESVSRNIERLSYTRRLSARKLINTLPTDSNPSGYIISSAEDLLTLFDADFGVIAIGNEAKILGPLSASQEVLAVTEYLRIKKFQQVITSQDVATDFPDMSLPTGLEVIAGLLLVPLSSSGIDFITFLRKAQTRHVNWAGKPFKQGQEGTAVLEPRKSFKIWSETVIGTCRAWKDEELETASVLCLVYGKFISVWRQREQAMQYNQLNKLLLSNATHEVRTPLNHIINYLEMALDSPLDADTRENLSKSHLASKSLLFVINDLLDLTRHEEGNNLLLQEPFDLALTVREAVEMYEWEAKRKKVEFGVETRPEKCFVLGDATRVRQIVVNTVSNSIKHTSQGHIQVEMRKRTQEEIISELPDDCDMEIELVISDTGTGIPREKLEAIFREFEQVESVIAEPTARRGEGDDRKEVVKQTGTSDKQQSKGDNESGLGLGLAIVARVVKNLGGQLRVDSTVGQGSRFTYYLPFKSSSPHEATDSEQKMRRSNSIESKESGSSSVKSEISSLVEAIAAPHLDDPRGPSVRSSFDDHRGTLRNVAGNATGTPKNGEPTSSTASPASNQATFHRQGATLIPQLRKRGSHLHSHEGSVPLGGSVIPLRSVKVDPHELDSLERAGQAADLEGGMRHGELPKRDSVSSSNTAQDAKKSPPDPEAKEKPAEARAEKSTTLPTSTSSHSSISGRQDKLSPLRVLVVEDDPINRMILKKRLALDGHTVMLAVNGEEGVHQFQQSGHEIDVILMDLQMPICNGQDACKRIRAFEKEKDNKNELANRPPSHVLNGRVPIFAVSATLDFKMRQEMCDIGMDGWVLKPIDFSRLKSIMRCITHLEQRDHERWKPGHVWEKGGWLSSNR